MSKFQSTISIVAALASIFGAATAGWKLAESTTNTPPTVLDKKLNQLDQKIEQLSVPTESIPQIQLEKPTVVTAPNQVVTIPEKLPPLPPLPSQEEPKSGEFE